MRNPESAIPPNNPEQTNDSKQNILMSIAKKIIESTKAIRPVRTDRKLMNGLPKSKEPSKQEYKNFGKAVAHMDMCFRKFVIGDNGAPVISSTKADDIKTMIYKSVITNVFKMMTCETAVAYILYYLITNKINVPFTILTFCNYVHQFAVLGIDADERTLHSLLAHPFSIQTIPAYRYIVVIDLWNLEKPIQTINEFAESMTRLFKKEPDIHAGSKLLLVNPVGVAKQPQADLNVMVQFHLNKAHADCQFIYDSIIKIESESFENFIKRVKKNPESNPSITQQKSLATNTDGPNKGFVSATPAWSDIAALGLLPPPAESTSGTQAPNALLAKPEKEMAGLSSSSYQK